MNQNFPFIMTKTIKICAGSICNEWKLIYLRAWQLKVFLYSQTWSNCNYKRIEWSCVTEHLEIKASEYFFSFVAILSFCIKEYYIHEGWKSTWSPLVGFFIFDSVVLYKQSQSKLKKNTLQSNYLSRILPGDTSMLNMYFLVFFSASRYFYNVLSLDTWKVFLAIKK